VGEFPRFLDRAMGTISSSLSLRFLISFVGTAGKFQKFVLIIDGLSSLQRRENAMDLVWLPNTFPANVKLVLSCSAGMTAKEGSGFFFFFFFFFF
jgi:hypothetical protein